MSKNSKIVISVLIVIIIAIGIILITTRTKKQTAEQPLIIPESLETTEPVKTTPSKEPSVSITPEVTGVAAEIKGLDSDILNIYQSLNVGTIGITAHLEVLSKLQARVTAMKYLTTTERGNLEGQIRANIASLKSLQTKGEVNTGNIAQIARMYELLAPTVYTQGSIDRSVTIQEMFTNVSSVPNSAVTQAKTATDNAKKFLSSIVPDKGSVTIATANKNNILSARTKMKEASASFKTAIAK